MRYLIRKTAFLVLLSIIFMMNVSCPQNGGVNMFIAVGRSVDDKAPEIWILSHKNAEYMPEKDLTISGHFKDNVGVTRVVAQMSMSGAADDTTLTTEYRCEEQAEGDWSVTFRLSDMQKLGVFSGESTQANFKITAYDAMSNLRDIALYLFVDTKLPTVEWQKPAASVRFSSTEKSMTPAAFDDAYSIDDPTMIGYFHNGSTTISGFVNDNFTVGYTYLRFYDKYDNLVAVTPVINQTVTQNMIDDIDNINRDELDNNGKPKGFGFAPEINEDRSNRDIEIGVPSLNATAMSWSFDIDTNDLTTDTGWFKVGIVTADAAGNYNTDKDDGFKNQFVSPEWLYVRQDADIPRNNFNFVKGASISYGGTASGVAFDDDGVIKVRIAAVPDGEPVDLASDDWKGGSSETVVKGKTFVKTEVWASDTRNGAVILNWTCDVPEQGGNYDLYVLPFDKNGRYPENYRDEVSKYRTQFHVASEDDPKIVLDKRNITMLEDTCTVTGSFYDNQEVTSITASLINFDGDVTNDNTIDVYPGTGEGTFTITGRDDNYMITTGQITTKYMFSWTFTPSLFKDKSGNARGMTFKKADIRFIAYDDENHSGDDVLSLQGDTENPQFLDTTPDNNVMINSDVTFSGHIYDNVDVSEIRIYCEGIDGFEPRVWKSDAVDNSLEVSDKEEYNIVSATGTVRKYYKRSFSTVITPSDIKYAAPTVVIEIKDRVGNENTRMINIKGDTTPPIVSFNGVASGSYMNNDGSITVLVNPAVQDRTNKLFRDISTITISKGSNNEDVLYNDGTTDEWSFDAENFVYSKTFALSPDWAAKLTNGDVNIKVRAKDVGGNTGEGSLYFIYDITPPYGMEITMPELKDSTSFAQIADDTSADITLAKINSGSYLNQSVVFKGIATDNNKVAKTVIKFFKVSDSSLVGSVTVDLSGDKSTDLGAAVSGISGVPSSYEFTLDTTKIDDGNYYVEITSFDAAGNSAADTSQKRYFKILQDADKPRVDFNTKQNATLFKRGAVSAMAYDDDGFSEANHFQYLVSQDTDDTMLAAFDNGTGLKDLTPDDGKTFSFTVNVGDNDGDWKVWVRPFDKNGQKGKIHKLNVKVSSNERPVIEGGLTFSAVDASYNNTAYAGRVTVSARAFAGKAENSIVQMWYRLSSTDCPAATGLDGSDVTSDSLADVVIGGAKQGGWYVVDIGSPAARVTDTLTFNTKQLCSSTNYRKLNVEVKAVNNLGDLSESVQDSIMVDNAKPVVTITSPAEDATIDGLVSFRGSMTDQGPEIDSMFISYFDHNHDWSELSSITAAAIKADKVTGTPVLNKWHQMDRLDASWSYTYNASVLADVSDGKTVTVVAAAIDKLGNVGTFQTRLHLDQDNDRPIVKVNMNLSGKTTPSNYLLNKDGSLTGSVEDDDGVPRKIEYNYGTGWLIASENSQAFTFGVPDGKYAVNMRITDGMSGVFASSVTAGQNAVKLRGSDGKLFGAKGSTGNNADTLIYVTIDTQDPEISDIKFGLTDNPTSSWADFQNTVLGGDNNKLYVKFTVTEKNNISSCKYTFDGGSPVDAVSVSHEGDVYTYTAEITIPADKTGTANLEFIVTDEASRQDTYRATLRVDNAGPTVRITAPEKNNKTIALSGSVYDNGESGMKGVYISYFVSAPSAAQKEVSYITNASNQGEAKNKWKYIGNGSSSSWETTFDTTVLTNDLPEQKIDNYPLTVAAIDNNNNISIQTLILNIDQNSDRPMIKFLSTKLGSDMRSDNRTWITTDSISGTISDDDGVVKKIEVKVGDADWAPANTVLLSSGDNSFNYNKDKGLSDGDNNIYFRITDAEDGLFVSKAVFAYDSIIIEDASNPKVYYGKYADKADEVKKNTILYTTIDTTPPQINDEMFGDQDKNYTAISGLGVVTFGGTNKKRYLNIKFTAFDKNGIATNADTKPRVVLGN
ncbi:MAG: hypothetical protein IKN25_08065, partial [Spirochaetales bacterium]|nr:hypothetical protein [Spirochaetales bacterium]